VAGGYIARHHLPWKMKGDEKEEEPEVLGARRGKRETYLSF